MRKPPRNTIGKTVSSPEKFQVLVKSVLSELVAATAAVLSAFQSSARTSAELSRLLGVPKKAAWQFFRMAEVQDPLVAANFVPGRKPMHDLIAAACAAGVTSKVAERLKRAYEGFDKLVLDVARDRETFLAMLGDAAKDPGANADLDRHHRIQVYKSFTHFYGMHVECSSDLNFVKEPVMGERTEVHLRSVTGMCRLRPDAQCVVERHKRFDLKDPSRVMQSQPLDVEAFREHGAPVLPAFCSAPVPTMVVEYGAEPNVHVVEWGGDAIGTNGSVDVTTGTISRDSYPPPADGAEHGLRERTVVGYPVKRMTQTWFLHMSDSVKLLEPRLKTYLNPHAAQLSSEGERSKPQKLAGSLEFFAPGSWGKLQSRFTGIREQAAYVCAIMKWNPADFAIYELSVDYPLLHSVYLTELPWR